MAQEVYESATWQGMKKSAEGPSEATARQKEFSVVTRRGQIPCK